VCADAVPTSFNHLRLINALCAKGGKGDVASVKECLADMTAEERADFFKSKRDGINLIYSHLMQACVFAKLEIVKVLIIL
jgi:uncharacterized hydantoinase/oxoprolinase family protein